jgi:hypothetical protein
VKQKIFLLIDEAGRKKSPWNQAFHLFIITLILLSITAISRTNRCGPGTSRSFIFLSSLPWSSFR